MTLPDKVAALDVTVGDSGSQAASAVGTLTRSSQYAFAYRPDATTPISLLMPIADRAFVDGDLFAAMDMNLPEGFLFQQLLERFPKTRLTKMHLLWLMRDAGIGRLGYRAPDDGLPREVARVTEAEILASTAGPALFAQLVDAYLGIGSGLSGVQPKVVVPTRVTLPIPTLIVKMESARYPGLSANEWMCLTAAQASGLVTPRFDLSADGTLLVVDRFDITPVGGRLGFEDAAALMDLRVHDRLSARKYLGSYEDVARLLAYVATESDPALAEFFAQVVLTVLVRNGDAHLKNVGCLYDGAKVWLAPIYDVVCTAAYRYERPDGSTDIDRTLALKLRVGAKHRRYPTRDDLLRFGTEVCRVRKPAETVERVRGGMADALRRAEHDPRVPQRVWHDVRALWSESMAA